MLSKSLLLTQGLQLDDKKYLADTLKVQIFLAGGGNLL
jgi:hypothetical protein